MAPRRDNIIEVDPRKGCSAALVIVLIVLGILTIMLSYHIVQPGYRGVKITLGKASEGYLPEGLSFKMPFIAKVLDMPVKQITQQGKADVFSSDLQNIQIDYNVMYRIPEDMVVKLTTQYEGDPYEKLLEPRIQERIKQVTATYRAEDLVKKREDVKTRTLDSVTSALDGLISVEDLTITNIGLSDQLEAAIEQKVIREQEALAKKFELEKAQRDAEITIVQAKAEAEGVRIKGEAITSAPQVIDLEIARKWDGKAPQSVVTGVGGSNVLLPLR